MASSRAWPTRRVSHRDPGGDPVVGHGEQPGAQAPRGGDLGGDLGQRRARAQPLGAEEVGGQVAVAESEPRGHAVAVEGVDRGEGLALEAPAQRGVVGVGERVRDAVEVGADPQPVELVVVARVDDRGDRRGIDDVDQPAEEAGGPDTSGQSDEHARTVPAPPASLLRARGRRPARAWSAARVASFGRSSRSRSDSPAGLFGLPEEQPRALGGELVVVVPADGGEVPELVGAAPDAGPEVMDLEADALVAAGPTAFAVALADDSLGLLARGSTRRVRR